MKHERVAHHYVLPLEGKHNTGAPDFVSSTKRSDAEHVILISNRNLHLLPTNHYALPSHLYALAHDDRGLTGYARASPPRF